MTQQTTLCRVVLSLLFPLCFGVSAQQDLDSLISKMTLREKAGEMTQLTLGAVSSVKGSATEAHQIDAKKLEEAIVKRHVGSILNACDISFELKHWHEVIRAIQELATKKTRLHIPVLYGVDAVHGANYTRESVLFPQSIGMAATWSPELVKLGAQATARDVKASGIPWNFAPVLDLARQPLWSRFFETYGEDVHLAKVLGRAAIEGMQGEGGIRPGGVAACMKHFVGYGSTVSGKDRTPGWIPERMLREYYLPTFESAIAAGAATLMVNSGELNGIPVHANKQLLTTLLRDELGFEGVVVTDWEDVKKLITMHRVAPTYKEATRLVIEAGIDLCMVPETYEFTDAVIALVEEGSVSVERIDESVKRLLVLKQKLGLFEDAMPDTKLALQVGTKADQALSLQAARESMTLLKNSDSVLPLKRGTKVLLTGPGADSVPMLHGAWSHTWQGQDAKAYPSGLDTLKTALDKAVGSSALSHVPGVSLDKALDIEAAVKAARSSDVVIVAIGEEPSVEKPGDIEDLTLSRPQLDLVHALKTAGKPIILVLIQGRPRIISEIEPHASAILCAYLPGPYGGEAISDVLTGKFNPSGRLPFTYPRHSGSLVAYDHKESDRHDKNFGLNAFNPQFEFGHGLSYTKFEYSKLSVTPKALSSKQALTINVTVKNSGKQSGQEVVRLFVRDDFASVTPPVQRLRGFQKVSLKPGQSRRLSFKLWPKDLAFVGQDLAWVVEPGTFEVRVGGLSAPFSFKTSK